MPALEKRYDQDDSSASSEEDFVNASSATPVPSSGPGSAAGAARPSSRTSHASRGSRSSKRGKVHSSSSSESTDSEEEAELRDELASVDLEAGTVRGAPVEGHVERVMRSIAKGRRSGATGQQSYAAVDPRGPRRTKSHRSSRKRSTRSYSLGAAPTAAHPASTYVESVPTLKDNAVPRKSKHHWWIYILLAILLIGVIGVIVFFVVRNNQSDDSSEALAANSTAASDREKSDSSASGSFSASGSLLTDLPGLTGAKTSGTATAAGTATFDDGKYRPATTTSVPAASSGTSGAPVHGTEDLTAATKDLAHTGAEGHAATTSIGNVGYATKSLSTLPKPTGTQAGVQAPPQSYGNNSPQATGPAGSPSAWPPQQNQEGQQNQQQPPAGSWWSAPQDQSHEYGQQQQPSQHDQPPQQQPGSPQGPGAWYGGQSQQGQQGDWQKPPAQQGQQGDWQQKPPSYEGQGQGQRPGQYQNGQGAGYPYSAAAPLGPGPYIGSGPAPSSSSSSDGSHWDAAAGAGAGAGAGAVAGGWQPNGGWPTQQPQVPLHPFANVTAYQAKKPEAFQNFTGNGTWFESSQHFGACGYATDETDFVVALSNQTWATSRASKEAGAPSKYCGAEVLVTNMQNGVTLKAWVTEHCARCVGDNALDLSKVAFEQLTAETGGLDLGVVPIVWGFTGNVTSAQPHTIGAPLKSSGDENRGKKEDDENADGAEEDDGSDDASHSETALSDGGWFSGWFGSGEDSSDKGLD
ncbi:hypothetical protein JCM3774_002517 [Rhodotorula dairenensis]